MNLSTSLTGFAGKVSTLTLVLLLSCVTFTNQSCAGVKLPAEVNSIVGKLSTQLPKFMGQATELFGPKHADQAKSLLDMIGQATKLTKGGKTQGVSDMFASLGKDNVQSYVDNWKSKGKLSADEIASATEGVNSALGAIKKAGKIK